jgi:tetratricopeptide (TPR) repeat protein
MGKKKKKAKDKPKKEVSSKNLKERESLAVRFANVVRHRFIVGVLLFALSFGVFAPSLGNEFVWDDISYIQLKSHESLTFRGMISNILNPFKALEREPKHFRPILYSSWGMDYKIWGLSPFGFHLTNVIAYSISVVLFYLFALLTLEAFKIGATDATAFLSSLLFAIYPMHVEPVSFVAARADLICSIFLFSAIIFHLLSYRNLLFLLLTLITFYLSLLTKEIAITFPFVVLGLDLTSRRISRQSNLLRYGFYGGLLFVYLYYRWGTIADILGFSSLGFSIDEIVISRIHFISSAFANDSSQHSFRLISSAWERSDLFLNSFLFYILKLVFPFKLNPLIASAPKGLYYSVMSCITLLILIVICVVSVRKREGITAFSIIWILVNLGPPAVVAALPVALTPLAERFLYIPSAGFCLLAGYLIVEGGRTYQVMKVAWVVGLALCVTYLYFTIGGQSVWKDSLSLWKKAASQSRDIYSAHLNYGNALRKADKKEEAIREYLSAIQVGTVGGKAQAYNNIGAVYIDLGEYDKAEKSFRNAIDLNPRDIRPHFNLGFMYFVKGDRILQSVLKTKRGDARSAAELNSELKLAEQSFELAEKYLNKTLELRGSYGLAHFYLAEIYVRFGEIPKAKEHAENALRSGLRDKLAKRARQILEMN